MRGIQALLLALMMGLPAEAREALPHSVPHSGRRPFALLGQDQGLPSPAVVCLGQDEDGFLYLGSENGLIRYDGTGAFRQWGVEDGLPSALVHQLLPARNGGLWVATYRGLVRFRQGRFQPAVLGSEPPMTPPSALAEDARGRLWVLTAKGLFVQKEELAFERFPLDLKGRIQTLHAGKRSGAVYLASPEGLLALLPQGGTRFWGLAEGLPADGATTVVEDGQGRLWAGRGRTLVMKAPGSDRFEDRSSLLGGSLSPNSLPWVEPDGTVWLPTQNGAVHLTAEGRELLDEAAGLPFRWSRTLFRDQEDTLWVVGPALARLQGGGRVWNYALSRGGSGEVVWSIARDGAGRLVVGTDDGAARLESGGLVRIPGTEGRRIKALREDGSGLLWMVSTTGPALWLRPGASAAEKAPLGEGGVAVNTVTEDRAGRVWLGHAREGVLRWDPASRKLVQDVGPAFVQAPSLGVFGFREDAQGRLWAGSTAGLLVRDAQGTWRRFTERDGLRPHIIHGLDFLPDGSAWIHYQEPVGLTRVSLEGGRFRVLEHRTKAEGLRSNLIFALRVDASGRTWATSDQGLFSLNPPLHLGYVEGLPTEDCALHALFLEGGRVWLGTSGGLTRFEIGEARGFVAPPRVHILQMTAGRQRLEAPFGKLNPFPGNQSSLGFRLATPAYLKEREVRFQVRLVGHDDEWQDAEGRSAAYPSLPGGSYRFEARAAVGAGAFGPVAALDVTVRPVWWKTRWATLGQVLGALLLIWGLVSLRIRSLARSKAELEVQVGERTEELRKRNQELLVALGRVKQLSGLLPICSSCKKIRDDKGYWNQLEHYISDHSEADFTHGICPECVKVVYPELQDGPGS